MVAGATLCGSAFAQSETSATPVLVVARQSQSVQTPTASGENGISYQQNGSASATLKVYTEGFLFCGNVGDGTPSGPQLALTTAHEDKAFSPGHPWTFAPTSVSTFGYNGGQLNVATTNVTCLSTTNDGAVTSSLYEGIFDNGYDSATVENYRHLINLNPATGFDWNAPDWIQVPADACGADAYQQAHVPEDVACAAVTGVRAGTVRAPTMWTSTDGISLTYLFRVDARMGAPSPGQTAQLQVPTAAGLDAPSSVVGLTTRLREAYDGVYLSSQGQYCFLNSLPTVLNSSVCTGATNYTLTGPLDFALPTIAPPPVGQGSSSFYVAVTRPLKGAHSELATPVVGVSMLVERAMSDEGGDKFTGDDVVFGFMPTSAGFPWMSGQ